MTGKLINYLLAILWARILLPLIKKLGKKLYDWWKNRKRNVQSFTKVMGALWRSRQRRG